MRKIVVTKDGSHTIAIPEQRVTYHSLHGAVAESNHVFIDAGLNYLVGKKPDEEIFLFEMGFGTGLNAFLTAIAAAELKTTIHYTTIETLPLSMDEVLLLNYPEILGHKDLFEQIHRCKWEEDIRFNEFFTLQKINKDLFNFSTSKPFNLIYYDAFAPSAQPELWTKEVFEHLYNLLMPAGVVVTYCSKGVVRRAMVAAGFGITKLPGHRAKGKCYVGRS